VATIGRDDLERFWRERYKPGSSAIVFVGDVTLAEAKALVERQFGGWQGGAAAEVAIPPAEPAPFGKIYLVDRPDSAQSVISQFLGAPRRKSDDYDALQLADLVWGGGGFGTRLNLNLREDKGYSYGVFSAVVQYREGGIWFGGGGVQTDKTTESVTEFAKELEDLGGKRPISPAELETSRLTRLRGYAQQFEAYTRISQQLADLWALDLPTTELQAEADRLALTTLDAARAAAAKYARPERSAMVVVGDRAKIEAGLRKLGLGEVVVLDVEGRPVK
jgi:zinc protease